MSIKNNKTILTAEPGKQEVLITREFDAPRELVFKAYTDPELYVQWIGPRGYSTKLEIFEPVSGGRWSFIQSDPQGNQYAFHGVNHEVLVPERIIDTFEYDGLPEKGHMVLDTIKLEALAGGRTRITVQSLFQSVADRDGMVQDGMEMGVVEGYERLDEVLEKLKVGEVSQRS